MFHMLEKEHAEEVDKKADEQYRKRCNEVLAHSKVLYKTRQEAMEQLKACDAYMQALTNCPAEFGRTGKTIQKGYQDFEKKSGKNSPPADRNGLPNPRLRHRLRGTEQNGGSLWYSTRIRICCTM